jgi:hypothetical protein
MLVVDGALDVITRLPKSVGRPYVTRRLPKARVEARLEAFIGLDSDLWAAIRRNGRRSLIVYIVAYRFSMFVLLHYICTRRPCYMCVN